jgi:hypothetical protein
VQSTKYKPFIPDVAPETVNVVPPDVAAVVAQVRTPLAGVSIPIPKFSHTATLSGMRTMFGFQD